MAQEPGRHDWIWHELMTTDPEAAAKFYGEVVGWTITKYPAPIDVPQYWVGNVGERGVVGFMGLPAGMPANWSGYIHTAEVDATAQEIAASGGSVLREPWEIPGVGRLAVVADPEGGVFNLMQPGLMDAPPKLAMQTPGNISWCELFSDAPKANFAWYEKLFGWQRAGAMGPDDSYQMFTSSEEPMTGGSTAKMGGPGPTHWLFYFHVADLGASMKLAETRGGSFRMGPREVPGGSYISLGSDPQGASFALHSMVK